MKRIILVVTTLFLISCSSALNLNVPHLRFVDTHVGNIVSEKATVHYMMRYKLSDDAPTNLFARLYYQDLTNKKVFHSTDIGSIGNVKIINFNSTPSSKIINKQFFKISLLLYKDANYTQSLGIHNDQVWFEMPDTVAEILKIELIKD